MRLTSRVFQSSSKLAVKAAACFGAIKGHGLAVIKNTDALKIKYEALKADGLNSRKAEPSQYAAPVRIFTVHRGLN